MPDKRRSHRQPQAMPARVKVVINFDRELGLAVITGQVTAEGLGDFEDAITRDLTRSKRVTEVDIGAEALCEADLGTTNWVVASRRCQALRVRISSALLKWTEKFAARAANKAAKANRPPSAREKRDAAVHAARMDAARQWPQR